MKKNKVLSISILLCLVGFLGVVAGCAPQGANAQGSEGEHGMDSVAQTAWSADSDCAGCHAQQGRSLGDSACLASVHASQNLECASCHADSSELESAHSDASIEKAEKATKLRKTSVDEQFCISCHGSYEDLAAKTAAATALTDSEGTQVNPHALPENKDHDDIDCSSCHGMHEADNAEESARETCLSCHHSNVYACNTCHE